jgi:transcriptional regulator with PAS, ATPase and Fis domain
MQILHTHIAQQMAESITNITGIEVEVMDDSLSMIAGTANICKNIKKRINSYKYISKRVLHNRETLVISNPGYHDLCATCKVINKCNVTAKLFYPLLNNRRETEGVIVFASKNKVQSEYLIEKKEALIIFLDYIRKLASEKTNERNSENFTRHQLQVVLEAFNEGLILLDEHGVINQINKAATEIIGLPGEKIAGKNLRTFINDDRLHNILSSGKFDNYKAHIKTVLGSDGNFYCNALPINYYNEYRGAVFTLRTSKDDVFNNIENASEKTDSLLTSILGVSPEIKLIKEQVRKVALSDSTVLITGESGTGKELIARAIHQESKRKNNPFIAINCSAIPENLLESELFGYEEGAFTGAKKGGKPGKFQLAHKGVIFLDEIGDMSLPLQAKLLRVLEDRVIEPVGSTRQILIDIRIIAASNSRQPPNVASEACFLAGIYWDYQGKPLKRWAFWS